jgi:allantoin racemase
MRIQVIIPWLADENLLAYERLFIPKDVEVVSLKEGLLAESFSDLSRNLPPLLDKIKEAEKKGYDAVVLACFGDPGVEESRELVSIPVIGPLNVALNAAGMIGHRTLLLVPEYEGGRFFARRNIAVYGLQDRVVVRGSRASIPDALNAYEDYKATGKINPFISEMIDICVKSIKEDDVDVIVFGCGGIKWMKEILESELAKIGHNITVINPLPLAVEMARVLVNLKLAHNKTGYPSPPKASERYKNLVV